MSLATYSPEFTDLILSNGSMNFIVTGYAEGTFLTLEPHAERFAPTYGAKGEPYRVRNAIKAFNLTLALSQTSHANDVLSLLLQNDIETLDGTFTCTLKDSSGTTIFTDEFAYIGEEPSQAFSGGGSLENREWTIHLPSPSGLIGGNGNFSSDTQRVVENLGGTVDSQWQSS